MRIDDLHHISLAAEGTFNLPEVIRHDGEVAETVNCGEMDRVAWAKSRWAPPFQQEDYRLEGCEGAF